MICNREIARLIGYFLTAIIHIYESSNDIFLLVSESDKKHLDKVRGKLRKVIHFALGIIAVIIALPFILLIMFLSFFCSQQQWEEFWDSFLEL